MLHSIAPTVNILNNHGIFIKTKKLALVKYY